MAKAEDQLNTNNKDIICESKKHKIVYIFPIFLILLGGWLLFSKQIMFMTFLCRILGIFLILSSIYKILKLKSIRWTLTSNEIILKSGVFSWQESVFYVPFDQIYEAYYYSGFWAHFFGYGTLKIRRTDGVSSTRIRSKMINCQEMVGKINQKVRLFKEQNKQHPVQQQPIQQQSPSSPTDELLKLMELKRQGGITEEEFVAMKRKIIS